MFPLMAPDVLPVLSRMRSKLMIPLAPTNRPVPPVIR